MPGSDSFCQRSLPRWNTPFGRWVASVGIDTIVDELKKDPNLQVTPQAVRQWLHGHEPRPARARALVAMSKGAITLETIYSHRTQLAELREESGRPAHP